MSGTPTWWKRPSWAGLTGRLNLPRVSQSADSGNINNAFTQIEAADAQNVKQGIEPHVPSIVMQATDGSSWRFYLDVPSPGSPAPIARFQRIEPGPSP